MAERHHWRLDPGFLTVNHGSFGATPMRVLAEQSAWRDRMESQPTRFMTTILPSALRAAADRLGAFLGADGRDIVFVDNATTGCNAVLKSLRLQPGDEIVALNHGYGAVRQAARFVAERSGARMIEAAIPFPRATDDDIVAAVTAVFSPRTRLAIIDHITSASALIMPLARIAGVPVLADGAHGPGQIDLDLPALGVDWYTGNCHKWLSAPKGCAFLWTAPHRQADTHPAVISHGNGYQAEFDWQGTRDPSAFLSIGAAIDFHEMLGGSDFRTRNIDLAGQAASLLAQRFNTETAGGDCAMRIVRLPVRGEAASFRARLLAAGTDAPVHRIGDALWLRLSAFAYNDLDDYDRLGDIVMRESTA